MFLIKANKPSAYGIARREGRRCVGYTMWVEEPNEQLYIELIERLDKELKPDRHSHESALITPFGETKPFQYIYGHMLFDYRGIGGPALTEVIHGDARETRRIMREVARKYGYAWRRWRE